jgi:carboxymethylenebutenolidase
LNNYTIDFVYFLIFKYMGENTMRTATIIIAAMVIFTAVPGFGQQLPPSNETAPAALEQSPRHGEFVDVAFPEGDYPIKSWVVYPERPTRAPVIVVIHEIFGLTDWIRAIADDLAREGYLAIAPDFISGLGPAGGGTESFESRDDVVRTIRSLTPEDVTKRLDAVRDYALTIPAATENFAIIGFCWGGAMSFHYATAQPGLDAAVVFYGTSPDTELLRSIESPVLGLYAEDDARVNVTIEPAAEEMERLGKTFEWYMYPGAGHGFVRQQEGRDGANLSATERAWEQMFIFLHEHLE